MVPVLAPESLFLEALGATDRLTPFVEDGRPEERSTLLDASSVVDVVFPDFDFVPPEDVDVVDEDWVGGAGVLLSSFVVGLFGVVAGVLGVVGGVLLVAGGGGVLFFSVESAEGFCDVVGATGVSLDVLWVAGGGVVCCWEVVGGALDVWAGGGGGDEDEDEGGGGGGGGEEDVSFDGVDEEDEEEGGAGFGSVMPSNTWDTLFNNCGWTKESVWNRIKANSTEW